jgi:hypothetical protein
MKNLILKLAGLLIIIHLFTSCDPAISYKYYLNNNSDSILVVKHICKGHDTPFIMTECTPNDSIIKVLPKTHILILKARICDSNPHDEKNEFLKVFDFLSISRENLLPIKKDIHKRENWKYTNVISHLGTIRTGTNIYSLDLTNDDIE